MRMVAEKAAAAKQDGHLVERALRKLGVEKSDSGARFQHDPRVLAATKVGGYLVRELKSGAKVRVKVVENGYVWKGEHYTSLSAIALLATGTSWNGLLFFRLMPYTLRGRRGIDDAVIKEQYEEAAHRYALAAAVLRLPAIPGRLDELLANAEAGEARLSAAQIHEVANKLKHLAGVLDLGANLVEARHGHAGTG